LLTKTELVKKVAQLAGLTQSDAGKAIDAMIEAIKESLSREDRVVFAGFGTFYVAKRKARKGRNPKTGQEIKIPATKVPKFTAGKSLKEAVR